MRNKFLVVDDSAAIHQIYRMLMAVRYKCEVISALSGQEGLDLLLENPDVNLLIVDADMSPHMSGLEFIEKVKEQESYCDIPIIFVLNSDREEDALALAHGNLRKPFTSNELHSIIEQLFQQNVIPRTEQ